MMSRTPFYNSECMECFMYSNCMNIDTSQCDSCMTHQEECGIYDCDVTGICKVIQNFILKYLQTDNIS